jgi:hypothetical protein
MSNLFREVKKKYFVLIRTISRFIPGGKYRARKRQEQESRTEPFVTRKMRQSSKSSRISRGIWTLDWTQWMQILQLPRGKYFYFGLEKH